MTKSRAQPRMLQWARGPYLWRTKVQCSAASLDSTGVSEPHQEVPTPPGRNIWPRPQRPQSPVIKIKIVHPISSCMCCISFHFVFVYSSSTNSRAKLTTKCVYISPTIWNLWSDMYEHSVTRLCPTLCDPMDCSLPGSSVRGILQAGILEWVAVPTSRGFPHPRY